MAYFVFVTTEGFIDSMQELPMHPAPTNAGQWHQSDVKLDLRRAHGAQRWQWNGGAPALVDLRPLAEIQRAKKDEINAAHELANLTSFVFQGKDIQANAHSMRQIEVTNGGVLARGALRATWGGAWKALDNSYVAIPDVATWRAFYDAIEETGTNNYNRAQALKAQVDAALTAEAVAAITWNAIGDP